MTIDHPCSHVSVDHGPVTNVSFTVVKLSSEQSRQVITIVTE
jgi:hypothetical protein